jgi:hypothetical protein
MFVSGSVVPLYQLELQINHFKRLLSVLINVLDKCRLHKAVQEKEHGLDSLGRIPCYICALFSRTHSKLRNSGWISHSQTH